MANTVQLKKNGQIVYPITDRSCIIGLEEGPVMSCRYAWDGTTTPDVTKIPAGVTVEYNSNTYIGTLAASASTVGYQYLVYNTTSTEFDRYATDATGGSYAWKPMGDTTIQSPDIADNLTTNDSTKALSAKQGKILNEELEGLEAEVTEIGNQIGFEMTPMSETVSGLTQSEQKINTSTGKWITVTNNERYCIWTDIVPGVTYKVTARSSRAAIIAILAEDALGVSGDDVVFATGFPSVINIEAGGVYTFVAPTDAKGMYFQRLNSIQANTSPSSIAWNNYSSEIPDIKEDILDINEEILNINKNDETLGYELDSTGKAIIEQLHFAISENISTENLPGYTIDANTGVIRTTSTEGAKVEYFPVNAGDIIRITVNSTSSNRIAYGLFDSIEANAVAIDFKSFPSTTSSFKEYYFVGKAGYFAIYNLTEHYLRRLYNLMYSNDYVSRCLFNRFSVSDGGVLSTTGDLGVNASRLVTDYIDITSYVSLVYTRAISTGTSSFGLAFYDENKGFISGVKEVPNSEYQGYVIRKQTIPEGAVYARFTFWKNFKYGNFWFGDASRDPVIAKLIEEADYSKIYAPRLSGTSTYFDGAGTTFVYGESLYLNDEQRVLKFVLRDSEYSSSASDSQVKFGIYACDNNDTRSALCRVTATDTLQREYIVIVPEGTKYIQIGGRCNSGDSVVCDVVDVTREYHLDKLVAADIIPYPSASGTTNYNRGAFYFELDDTVLQVVPKTGSPSFTYQVNGVAVDSEHAITNTIILAWNSNASTTLYGGTYTYGRVQLNKSNAVFDDTAIAEFLTEFDMFVASKSKKKAILAESEERLTLYGETYSSGRTIIQFNSFAKPRIEMNLRIVLPSWMRVRFYTGLRTGKSYTNYYYNGDIVPFTATQGSVRTEISLLSESTTYIANYQKLVSEGAILFAIADSYDKDIYTRNFDAEKYLGAIEATPGTDGGVRLPMIVHVSDVHSDTKRFNSAFDYADYLKADILINTGDNPHYTLVDDKVGWHETIVKAHKTDFANCLGNHDTYSTSLSSILGTAIVPFAETYGYHKLTDSDVTDKAYYFKDLTDCKLRIIALDQYDEVVTSNYRARISKTQIDWFINTLAATPEGFGVIVIFHAIPHLLNPIEGKTAFIDNTVSAQQNTWDSDYMTNGKLLGMPVCKIIDAFISRGTVSGTYTQRELEGTVSDREEISYEADFTNVAEGVEFIAYLNGHNHRDFVGYVSDCEQIQLNLNICSANPLSQSTGYNGKTDIMRNGFGSNQDAFNVYTIDRNNKVVGIARIGANMTKSLVDRKVMFVNYAEA